MAKRADYERAISVLAMEAGAAGKVPEWTQLIPFGEHNTDKGKVILDAAGAAAVVEYYKSRKNDPVIDYEHQTQKDVIAPAAGWIQELENRGEAGIWGRVSWCKRAADMLENREYRYISPVMGLAAGRRIVCLFMAGLTNFPAIDGMEPVVAKQNTNGGDAEPKEESITMKIILEALGLAATATENEAVTAISALKDAAGKVPVACKKVLTALGLQDNASESETVGTIVAMKSGSDKTPELAAQVKNLSDQLAARDADELVQVAMKAGKIAPAQAEWAKKYAATDPEGFKVFAAKAPVVVPQGETDKKPGQQPEAQGLTPAEQIACKALGVSEEAFKKHNNKA